MSKELTAKEKWTAIWHAKQIPNGEKLVAYLHTIFGFTPEAPKLDEGGNEELLSFDLQRHSEKYRRSPNQGGNIDPRFIVLHDAYGTWQGTIAWILKKVSKVSYHYLIDVDGSRIQFVWDSKRAYHAGKSYWKGYTNLNAYSIGIAFTGNGRNVTDAEIDSCARKCIELIKKFPKMQSNPLEEVVITHKHIAPKRKIDTTHSNWQRVIQRIKEIRQNER